MDHHVMRPRWISFDSVVETVDEFLAKWIPSEMRSPLVEWICIRAKPAVPNPHGNVARDLMDAWDALCYAKNDKVSWQDVETLGRVHNVLSGKWMLYLGRNEIDAAWALIARAVIDGRLGDAAKVSTSQLDGNGKSDGKRESKAVANWKKKIKTEGEQNPSSCHVICVYSSNFDDVPDLMALRWKLRDLGFTRNIKYKPDVYTFCGIYSGNRWNIPPTRYGA